jgi:hypothetical protein
MQTFDCVGLRLLRLLSRPSSLGVATLASLLFAGPLVLDAQPSATTTALTVGQAAINSGIVVLLTATVTASSSVVAAGQVQFLDGKLTLGTLQGVAQTNGSLVAKLPTRSFVPGVHSLTARFVGARFSASPTAASTSSAVTLTVASRRRASWRNNC